jgi:hypothetical protein
MLDNRRFCRADEPMAAPDARAQRVRPVKVARIAADVQGVGVRVKLAKFLNDKLRAEWSAEGLEEATTAALTRMPVAGIGMRIGDVR